MPFSYFIVKTQAAVEKQLIRVFTLDNCFYIFITVFFCLFLTIYCCSFRHLSRLLTMPLAMMRTYSQSRTHLYLRGGSVIAVSWKMPLARSLLASEWEAVSAEGLPSLRCTWLCLGWVRNTSTAMILRLWRIKQKYIQAGILEHSCIVLNCIFNWGYLHLLWCPSVNQWC